MKKLASQMAVLTAARLAGAGCLFLITLLLARNFGADLVANYSLLLSSASILSVILPLGFHAIATLFAAEYKTLQQYDKLQQFTLYSHKLIFYMALSAFPFALIAVYLASNDSPYNVWALALLSVPTAFAMANIYTNSALLIGLEHHFWAHLPDMILRPLLLLLGLLSLMLFDLDKTEMVLSIVFIAATLTMLLQWKALNTLLPKTNTPLPLSDEQKSERKKWWHLAPNHMKITLLWDYFFELHLLLAGFLMAPDHVALLFICFRIRQLAGFGMRSLYSLLMPKIISTNVTNKKQETQATISLAVRLTCLYALVAWFGMTLIGPYILKAFGSIYEDGYVILLIMMGTMVVRGLFGPASTILGMHRHADSVVKILVLTLILSLLIMLAGIALFPAYAIAVAYLISTSFSAIAIWWVAKRKTSLNTAIWA